MILSRLQTLEIYTVIIEGHVTDQLCSGKSQEKIKAFIFKSQVQTIPDYIISDIYYWVEINTQTDTKPINDQRSNYSSKFNFKIQVIIYSVTHMLKDNGI